MYLLNYENVDIETNYKRCALIRQNIKYLNISVRTLRSIDICSLSRTHIYFIIKFFSIIQV